MASTRLQRKARRNKAKAKKKVAEIQRLKSKPVIKNVDVEEIKKEFAKQGSSKKAEPKTEKAESKAEKSEPKAEKAEKSDSKAEKAEKPAAKKASKKDESDKEEK